MVQQLKNEDLAYHSVSEFESGRRDPSLMILLQYARAANVPVEYLIDDNLDLPL
jgi:transcriptional regulator with XRE-family HTH domain